MQEKIDRFNAAFVDMAADYVERLRLKIVQVWQSLICTSF